MNKKQASISKSSSSAEKPLSLAPLSTVEALRALLQVKPVKGEALKKASKKQTATKHKVAR